MRLRAIQSLLFFGLILPLAWTTPAEARLFRQTYGATVPTADGCTWNWNQDYFVPRHVTSCRYGLYSPCKSSCSTSPACKTAHPIYHGYCNIYTACRYCWRDHVYRTHCGCTPLRLCHGGNCGRCKVPFRHGHHPGCGACAPGCTASSSCCWDHTHELNSPYSTIMVAPLPNVEAPGLVVLGSVPVEGNVLLGNDLSVLEQGISDSPTNISLENLLPALGLPQTQQSTQSIQDED